MYLNTHTYYSLKFGTLSPKELLLEMQQLGVDSFALTDINNTSALLEMLRLAQETQVRIIAGVDLRIGAKQIAVVLAKNNNGWLEINNYLSDSNVIAKKLAHPLPTFTDCVVIYPFQGAPKSALKPNEFIGVSLDSLSSFCLKKRTFGRHKYVILQTASFRNKRDFNAHRLLRAIANNTLLSKLPKTEEGAISHTFYPLEELNAAFAATPFLALNTQKLMRQCTIEFTFGNEH